VKNDRADNKQDQDNSERHTSCILLLFKAIFSGQQRDRRQCSYMYRARG
jgi:hypothetical protein